LIDSPQFMAKRALGAPNRRESEPILTNWRQKDEVNRPISEHSPLHGRGASRVLANGRLLPRFCHQFVRIGIFHRKIVTLSANVFFWRSGERMSDTQRDRATVFQARASIDIQCRLEGSLMQIARSLCVRLFRHLTLKKRYRQRKDMADLQSRLFH